MTSKFLENDSSLISIVCLAEEEKQDTLAEAEEEQDALTELEYPDNPDELADPYSEESPDELQNYGKADTL